MKKLVINKLASHLLLTFLLLFFGSVNLAAQGFIKKYPVNAEDWSYRPKITQTPNGYCITHIPYHTGPNPYTKLIKVETDLEGDTISTQPGTYDISVTPYLHATGCGTFEGRNNTFGLTYLALKRFDLTGNAFWSRTLQLGSPDVPFGFVNYLHTNDGGIMVAGGSQDEYMIQKHDSLGNRLWFVRHLWPFFDPAPDFGGCNLMMPTEDGGAILRLIFSFSGDQVFSLLKVAPNGSISTIVPLTNTGTEYNYFQPAENFNYYHVEEAYGPNQPNHVYLRKHTPNHDTLWTYDMHPLTQNFGLLYLQPTKDNGVLVVGSVFLGGLASNQKCLMARFDASGNLLWKKIHYGLDRFWIRDGIELEDGNFVLAGMQDHSLIMVKMDSNGVIYPNAVKGKLAYDPNENCLIDSSEMPFSGWVVKATANGTEYFVATDSSGEFEINDLPKGPAYTIDLEVQPPAFALEPCPIPQLTMPADTSGATLEAEIPIQGTILCPWMSVFLNTATLRQCQESDFKIEYINWGGGVAENAAIEVTLPEAIHFLHGSHTPTQTGQTVRFELGDVPALGYGAVYFTGLVSCDSSTVGQSLCVEAHVFPDSICENNGLWSTASIELDGQCAGDTVQLRIRNNGAAPTTKALEYLIIDDDVVMMQGTIPSGFPVGGEIIRRIPAKGSTLRVSCEQEPYHPVKTKPSIAVEGCNGLSLGFVTTFSNVTGDPFSDLLCLPVEETEIQNRMLAFPEGIDSLHFIEPDAYIKYIIQFQNSGDGKADQLVIRDTLPQWLDPATVQPTSSSHSFEWALDGQNLTFTFDQISLPDSNSNFNASKGYIVFAVFPRVDVPLGTRIENRATIRFDTDPIVFTNIVFHTIDTGYLEKNIVSAGHPKSPEDGILVFPNPAADAVSIILENDFSGKKSLVLTDAFGKTVQTKTFFGRQTHLRRGTLPAGLYFLKIVENERVVAASKVIWH